jgi:hypothetical protein
MSFPSHFQHKICVLISISQHNAIAIASTFTITVVVTHPNNLNTFL